MLFAPVVTSWGGGILLAFGPHRSRVASWLAVAVMCLTLTLLLVLAADVWRHGPRETVTGEWPVGVGIRLRADGLSVAFALLTTSALLLGLTADQASERGSIPRYPVFSLLMATGLNGLFLTGDLFNFYVFFELAMVAAYAMTVSPLTAPAARAGFTFMLVNLVGSIVLLASIAGVYHVTGTLDMSDIRNQLRTQPDPALLPAAGIFAAFGVKLGLFPFHYWVPPVYRQARPVVVVALSAGVANIGSYGLLRFGGDVFLRAFNTGEPVLLIVGFASILYGGILASGSRPVSEVLAYSAIADVGFVVVAVAIGGQEGNAAAVAYAIGSSLNKVLLFLCLERGGPLTTGAFLTGCLSIAGMPLTLGFFAKAAIFRAAVDQHEAWMVALLVAGSALSFVYMFRAFQRAHIEGGPGPRPGPLGRALIGGLAIALVAIGAWPQPLLAMSDQAASAIAVEEVE